MVTFTSKYPITQAFSLKYLCAFTYGVAIGFYNLGLQPKHNL